METSVGKILFCFFLICLKLASLSIGFREKNTIYAFKTFLDLNEDEKLTVDDFDQMAGYVVKLKRFETNGSEHKSIKDYVHKMFNNMLEQTGTTSVGYITVDQWVKMWDDYNANPTIVPEWQKNYVDLIFSWMDNNDDGFISKHDFVSFMELHGKSGTDASICFDKLSEGKVSVDKQRFLELWKQYFTSEDPLAPGNFLAGKSNIDNE